MCPCKRFGAHLEVVGPSKAKLFGRTSPDLADLVRTWSKLSGLVRSWPKGIFMFVAELQLWPFLTEFGLVRTSPAFASTVRTFSDAGKVFVYIFNFRFLHFEKEKTTRSVSKITFISFFTPVSTRLRRNVRKGS